MLPLIARIIFFIPLCVICGILFFTGCRKSDRDTDVSLKTAYENVVAENLFNDLFRQVHILAINDSLLNKTHVDTVAENCVSGIGISDSTGVFPVTFTIDFGKTNSSPCSDGRVRRGKIIAVFSGRYDAALTTITVNTDGYYVGDIRVDGKSVFTNRGRNSNGYMLFAYDAQNWVVSNDTMKVTWKSTGTYEWAAGENLYQDYSDDIFQYKANLTGVNTVGLSFTGETMTYLKAAMNCKWITNGTQKITPENRSPRTINYGDNSCDSKAKITLNGVDYEITMW